MCVHDAARRTTARRRVANVRRLAMNCSSLSGRLDARSNTTFAVQPTWCNNINANNYDCASYYTQQPTQLGLRLCLPPTTGNKCSPGEEFFCSPPAAPPSPPDGPPLPPHVPPPDSCAGLLIGRNDSRDPVCRSAGRTPEEQLGCPHVRAARWRRTWRRGRRALNGATRSTAIIGTAARGVPLLSYTACLLIRNYRTPFPPSPCRLPRPLLCQ